MMRSGADIVIECLKEQGVDTVFGYPGGTILNIYDALFRHPEIRHILTSHEQGAAHAADGYARATGRVGVVMATSGPGATNLVTGIATAYMDSVPIVAFTCNVGTSFLGKDSFQEVDIAGITLPITKYSVIIKDITKLAPMIRRAFKIARSGRPGPVLVDITKDVTEAFTEFFPRRPEIIGPRTSTIRDEAVTQAAEMINESERPVLFIGGGAVASGAAQELVELAHRAGIPVCDSLMGKGAFPGTDPLYMGMVGMHGTKTANRATHMCDLLIAAGVRFSDRDTGESDSFAKQAKIIQFDVDAAEINKNIRVDKSVIGDLRSILLRLNPQIRRREHAEWVREIERMREKYPLKYDTTRLTGPAVIEELYRQTKGNAIIVTDVGQHQMWTAQYYKFVRPRTLLTSGGLGTMGYGLGAAIGAGMAFPDRTVVNVAGDGCFRMNMQELMTAVRYNIPVVEIVLNNHVLGMVRQLQTLFYDGRYSNTVLNDSADFVKIAEGMGALAMRVENPAQLPAAIRTALGAGRPVLIDCIIDADDMVFPMAPSGEPIENAFDGDDLMENASRTT
ncbi:MAG: biosynthetic-type acetolactate synthase large subunit [Lachnospiraceae bacterium]|nr:biosynthetic-type acetolactate synthase large subunit [Lachnospiraceae bacterium]